MSEKSAEAQGSRRLLPIALVVLATVIGILAVFAIWVKRQALETESWVDTSSELLADETISNAVADFLVAELYDNVDVSGEIEGILPAPLAGLSGPITAGLRQATDDAARKALQEPKVQALWQDANRAAHEQLLAIIDDESTAVKRSDGAVVLDLVPILQQVAVQVGLSGERLEKLPDDVAEIEVMSEDDLDAIQAAVKLERTLAWLLAAITLGLYALAIYLARGRRRETLRAVGIGFIVVGVAVLFARGAAGNGVTDALASTSAAEPPVEDTWEIGTSMLKEGGQAVLAYGILIVLGAWLAGPAALATRLRGYAAPYLSERRVAYGVLAGLLVLLFWWGPTEATRRFLPALVLIALFVIALEALRSVTLRERSSA
jgi:hypothetical protein